MPVISIIVPIYNKEKYLYRCLDSILSQTFTDYELLLIDDGSTDGSCKICDEYAARDQRIRVFHKKNGGVSSARNIGINNIRGEYLTFIDSDDYVNVNYLDSLTPQKDEDFVMDSSDNRSPRFSDRMYNGIDMINVALSGWQILCPWGKLFKSELVIKHNIQFDENIHFGEDSQFNLEYLLYISSLRTSSSAEYNYVDDVKNSLSKDYVPFEQALYKARKVYDTGKKLSTKFQDTTIEISASKYAGITWTLWYSLLPYSIHVRAQYIKMLFSLPEINSLMKNYLHCSESGKKYILFYWLGKFNLEGIAAFIIP